jgi:hypothetical protein
VAGQTEDLPEETRGEQVLRRDLELPPMKLAASELEELILRSVEPKEMLLETVALVQVELETTELGLEAVGMVL